MQPQEQENRLDYLLDEQETDSLVPLAQYVAEIHNQKTFDLLPSEEMRWGNYDYLMQKLEHNFGLLGFLIAQCSESEWNESQRNLLRYNLDPASDYFELGNLLAECSKYDMALNFFEEALKHDTLKATAWK